MNQPPQHPIQPPFNGNDIAFNGLVVGRYYYLQKGAPLIVRVIEKTAQDVTFVVIQEWQGQRWGIVQEEEETCSAEEVGTNACMFYSPGNGGRRRKTHRGKRRGKKTAKK
jgi:hypothetical protein